MNPAERLEALDCILDDLRLRNEEVPILVEGDKDETALRALGFTGHIIKINRGLTMFAFSEAYARDWREAVVLTDWDRTGGQLARLLIDALEANGVRPDNTFRRAIARSTRKEILDVEGLHGYMESLRNAVARRHR